MSQWAHPRSFSLFLRCNGGLWDDLVFMASIMTSTPSYGRPKENTNTERSRTKWVKTENGERSDEREPD